MPDDASGQDVVLLIHGTAAAAPEDTGSAWWQTGSDTWRFLNEQLQGVARCSTVAFHWSGLNEEQERANAAASLAKFISKLEANGQPYHLIGHSHGGSVIWQMLRETKRVGAELEYLRSWSTLGTPFLTFGFKKISYWSAVPLVLVLLALALSLFNSTASLSIIGMAYGYAKNVRELLFDEQYASALLLPMLWIPILFTAYWYLSKFAASILRGRRVRSEGDLSTKSYGVYGHKHLAVWSRSDEAMAGLQSTVALNGRLVPRWAEVKTSRIGWLLSVLSTPFRAVYNRVLARASDEFVWDRLKQRLQGADQPSLMLMHVTPSPSPEYEGWPALPQPIEDALAALVNSRAADTLNEVRSALGLASVSGTEFSAVIGRVGPALSRDLVHTSYYLCPGVLQLLCLHVRSLHRKEGETGDMPRNEDDEGASRHWWMEGRIAAMKSTSARIVPTSSPSRRVLPAFVACCVSAFLGLVWFASVVTYRNTVGTYTDDYNINAIIPQSNRLLSSLGNFASDSVDWLSHLALTDRSSDLLATVGEIPAPARAKTLASVAALLARAGAPEYALEISNLIPRGEELAGALSQIAESALHLRKDLARTASLKAFQLYAGIERPSPDDLATLATVLAGMGENDKAANIARRALSSLSLTPVVVDRAGPTPALIALYTLSKSGLFREDVIRAVNQARSRKLSYDDQDFAAAALACAGDESDALDAERILRGATPPDVPAISLATVAHFQAGCGQADAANGTFSKAAVLALQTPTERGAAEALAYIAFEEARASQREAALANAREARVRLIAANDADSNGIFAMIADALAEAQQIGEALSAAHEIRDAALCAQTLCKIATIQVQGSKWSDTADTLSQALALTGGIADKRSRANACFQIVGVARGMLPEEIGMPGGPDEEIFCTAAIGVVAGMQARSGISQRTEENVSKAFQAADGIKDPFRRAKVLNSLVRNLAPAGLVDRARQAAAKEEQAAKAISQDEAKWDAFALVATNLARLQRYRAARNMVDNCGSSRSKVEAYTAILHEYLATRRPSLRNTLDSIGKNSFNNAL